MKLSPNEFERMEYLLGKSNYSNLAPTEQMELKRLIVKDQPSAQNDSLDELIKLGLILVGMYLLAKALE
ncbi:hypothetical protein [Methanolobus sp. ZRKC5]|uniref:hypothetical protein n=1 Tax=unclassified Methanolobus TaxID=2629569 RepID=UPI00313F2687